MGHFAGQLAKKEAQHKAKEQDHQLQISTSISYLISDQYSCVFDEFERDKSPLVGHLFRSPDSVVINGNRYFLHIPRMESYFPVSSKVEQMPYSLGIH